MSEIVLLALIASVTQLAAIILSRWMSHRENAQIKQSVEKVSNQINGGLVPPQPKEKP